MSVVHTLFDDPNPLCLSCGGPLAVAREQREVLCWACGWPAVAQDEYLFRPGRVEIGPRTLVVSVVRRTFGRASITAGPPEDHELLGVYDDSWDYEIPERAIYALIQWVGDPSLDEPEGWERHKPSNRRRPGGDARLEFVRA